MDTLLRWVPARTESSGENSRNDGRATRESKHAKIRETTKGSRWKKRTPRSALKPTAKKAKKKNTKRKPKQKRPKRTLTNDMCCRMLVGVEATCQPFFPPSILHEGFFEFSLSLPSPALYQTRLYFFSSTAHSFVYVFLFAVCWLDTPDRPFFSPILFALGSWA